MPRYFFHTADDGHDIDREGFDLANDADARVEGIRFAGAMMKDQPDLLWDGRDFRVAVTDENRRLLFTIIMLAVDAPRERDLTGG